ncbi:MULTISPECIES: nitroreductase family deazaflavin-dependent oxidoreductase [Streptomyces]|uniref:nitroreductase family deazaflavin-dependent oxidoreductase n=1 Tax=Streptomyces TaxID=1883 RepID=UPI0018E9EF1C|nr:MULTISPECIES: nitroreductase family deazaflavin-dependent oxidoreductase [unclassified Streptomyces]
MTAPDPFAIAPTDSRVRGIANHARLYADTAGAEGHDWNGAETLLLTTLGRRSALPRRTVLIYARHHDAFVVVASNLGADNHPDWYLNLQHHSTARVQVHDQQLTVHARTATSNEQPLLWQLMTDVWPAYDTYQQATTRPIPAVILQPQP